MFWTFQWTRLKRAANFQQNTVSQNVATATAVQRTVQLQCTVTVAVQTEISELSVTQFAKLPSDLQVQN